MFRFIVQAWRRIAMKWLIARIVAVVPTSTKKVCECLVIDRMSDGTYWSTRVSINGVEAYDVLMTMHYYRSRLVYKGDVSREMLKVLSLMLKMCKGQDALDKKAEKDRQSESLERAFKNIKSV